MLNWIVSDTQQYLDKSYKSSIRSEFNKFPDFFVQTFKIVVDSLKFSIFLLYILCDDWPIFMISGSNEQLQQQLEYTLLKPDCHSWWISKMQSGCEDTLEEWYAIKFCFKLGKNATTETYGMLQTAFRPSCMNRECVFEWHKRFKEGMESMWDDERCGRSKEVNTPELIGQRVRVRVIGISTRTMHQSTTPSLSQTIWPRWTSRQLLTLPVVQTLLPVTWLFPKLRGCHYEKIEEMKVAVTKVIDTLTQEDFHGAFQKLLERYKCVAAGRDYFEGDKSFMCVLSIKVPIRKKSGNLFNDPRLCINYVWYWITCSSWYAIRQNQTIPNLILSDGKLSLNLIEQKTIYYWKIPSHMFLSLLLAI